MNDKIKKLISKNRADYEPVALELINNADVNLFKELVNQDDYLFDFVKRNVAERLERACDTSNYKNLLSLMTIYSPFYEDFIVSVLSKYADEDLTDKMLEIFESGNEDEKAYCAKYFSIVQDSLALPFLREYAFDSNLSLAQNCAQTLGIFEDVQSYEDAIKKLHSEDDFEQFSGVSFLVLYGNKNAVPELISVMKKSTMSENIAGQIPYIQDLIELLKSDFNSGMLVINNILNGLGEIISLSAVIDFNFREIFNFILNKKQNSVVVAVLLNAKNKFEMLTENDEYLYDEDKNTKNEVFEIKKMLQNFKVESSLIDEELCDESDFVYTALEFSQNSEKIKNLLVSDNQTLILKSAEILKELCAFDENAKQTALSHLQDENLKAVLKAL